MTIRGRQRGRFDAGQREYCSRRPCPLLVAGATLTTLALLATPAAAQGLPIALEFTDVTAAAGLRFGLREGSPVSGLTPTEQSRYGAGAAAGDYDGDGDLDLYLAAHAGEAGRLYRNEGDGTFTDVTAAAGVGDLGWGHMALFLDLDDDGRPDLLVLNDDTATGVEPPSLVYRNRGDGTFEPRPDSGLLPIGRTVGGATAGDFDRDGDLDLYITDWIDLHNYLYRNEDEFRFTDVTAAAGLATLETLVHHWTPLFFDADGDGWQDLFCGVDFNEDYLFLNQQDGTFLLRDMPYHEGNDMGVAAGDFDRDGDTDLLTTNITQETAPAGCCNWLYENDGTGTFFDSAAAHGLEDTHWGWGCCFFDADLDGDLDLAAVNGWFTPGWLHPAQLFSQDAAGQFTDVAASAGFDHLGDSRGLLAFDYDRDGDLDLLVSDALSKVTLYENTTPREDRHYLSVRAVGRASNRDGVGARVTVSAGGESWSQEILAGGSFYTGPPLEAHFGLATAGVADSVTVEWPSGHVQVLAGPVAVDRVLTIIEDGP